MSMLEGSVGVADLQCPFGEAFIHPNLCHLRLLVGAHGSDYHLEPRYGECEIC